MLGLELHPEKPRLIEFGRFAAERRAQRGPGKPETFQRDHSSAAANKPRIVVREVGLSGAGSGWPKASSHRSLGQRPRTALSSGLFWPKAIFTQANRAR
jgi:hypothetical protein